MTLGERFNDMLLNNTAVYIFGAGDVAKRLYNLIVEHDGDDYRIKAFVVTDTGVNPEELYNKEVLGFSNNLDFNIPFLTSVSRAYHPEVYSMIENEGGYTIDGMPFYMLESASDKFDYTDNRDNNNENLRNLDENEIECRSKLVSMYKKYNQAFGENLFYQSFPRLHILGLRDTKQRLSLYETDRLLDNSMKVLDIGANDGFLDLSVASLVDSIIGVEYNEKLSEIASEAQKMLDITNVSFINDDYNHWKKQNSEKFDVIFSFAVHIWLGVTPSEYADDISHLLSNDGLFFFESQDYSKDERHYKEFCCAFSSENMKLIMDKKYNDTDGTCRRICIFKK